MSENVPYSSSECSESVPSFGNIEVNTSNFLEQFGVTTTTTTINSISNFSNIRDENMGATFSTEKGREGGLLEDIFQVLSEVPLHATEALHECLEASTSKNEEFFMQEKQGIESHDYTNIVAQDSQIDEGTEAKKETSQLVSEPTHTPPFGESHDHIPTRRRNREQRRRDRINVKLRELQALLPHSNKKDHASILDNAINYIKYLKRQVEMSSFSARSIGQSEHHASYNPLMIFGGTGYTHWPLHFPMAEPSNYPLMMRLNFPVRPMSHFPVTPPFAPQTISPVLLLPQPSAPIRLWPPIPYISPISNSPTDLATGPSSTMDQSTRIFSETNRQ